MNALALRGKHPVFCFENFTLDTSDNQLHITYAYRLEPNIRFETHLYLPLQKIPKDMSELEPYIFSLGMVEAVSYWKAACSPVFMVKAGSLTPGQLTWWQDLIIHGLGEFFYQNKIDFSSSKFLTIESSNQPHREAYIKSTPDADYSGDLILVGGGKDSVVTLELTKSLSKRRNVLLLNPNPAMREVAKEAGFSDPIMVKRTIDPKLLELNRQGYLNGHTPFSAYLAFLGQLVGKLYKFKHIIASNEESASEGNALFHGMEVNHQYSKSYRFETLFRDYTAHHLGPNPSYFSFLRPLSELQIARIFTQHQLGGAGFSMFEKYGGAFKSCNVGRGERWCGRCPKCAFVFLILSPFVPSEQLIALFGSDLLDNSELESTFIALVGLNGDKPFDCVGTKAESIQAVSLAIANYKKEGRVLPKNLALLKDKLKIHEPIAVEPLYQALTAHWNSHHFLPSVYENVLHDALKQSTAPATNIQEIKGANILLLGYGREGKSTHQFLLKHYPDVKISIADKKSVNPAAPAEHIYSGPGYLDQIQNFDTVVRTPGIPSHTKMLDDYRTNGGFVTTATNIFFSQCPGITIGITGTKGKSTTSALIANILGQQFPDVRFAGNIGNPMLDVLNGATAQSVFVIELSSHQLEDARYSPQIAVVLQIVPEHLDYYHDFEAYKQAKSNIVSYQKPKDLVIYNPTYETSRELIQTAKSQRYPYSQTPDSGSICNIDNNKIVIQQNKRKIPVLPLSEIPLKGNVNNILAAVTVAHALNITIENIRRGIKSFQPLPHRLELVGEFSGIQFYNDSLATIPEATIHALDALGDKAETLIAGGFDRGLNYTQLGTYLANRPGLKTLILLPDTGKNIWEAVVKAKNGQLKLKHITVSSMEEAIKTAFQQTSPGKICLLSPASASFNMFKDYAERGEKFKQLVQKYSQ